MKTIIINKNYKSKYTKKLKCHIIYMFCILESSNKNISQQLSDYKITFVNSFKRFLVYKNKSDSDLV